ncbi:MAG TPA: hypothetical protein PLD81_07535 [Elusimicrobiales bacterium]|nr:hypothetical protein [Elusimicrobiales bacterium]HPO95845.1 hypothetical protein [Elusimicrobiales bacterium]
MNWFKIFGQTEDGSTERLVQYSFLYFAMYVIYTMMTKRMQLAYGVDGTVFTVYNTMGGMLICVLVVLIFKWYKFKSSNYIKFLGLNMPKEFLYIIPSGICTAVVIPTTTLMYTLPISVMVAMVIMRASIIIISRIIDQIQIWQGILKKKVFWEENVGALFAVLALSVQLFVKINTSEGFRLEFFKVNPGDFDFLKNAAAMTILTFYLTAYSIRLYIMNYYKNTRPKGAIYDTKGFFAIEQIASTLFIVIVGVVYYYSVNVDISMPNYTKTFAYQFKDSFDNVPDKWAMIILSGIPFGIAAFFSVFLFMFKGRTATFAGLVNRVTSLVAGTASTIFLWLFFDMKKPKNEDWAALLLIFVAIYFMSLAEKRRACELIANKEIGSTSVECK